MKLALYIRLTLKYTLSSSSKGLLFDKLMIWKSKSNIRHFYFLNLKIEFVMQTDVKILTKK